jgi:hypothetical protein
MSEEIKNKPEEISARIQAINGDIKSHRKNIKLLHIYARKAKEIKIPPYIPRIVKYSCIPRSEKRFQWTLHNIKKQIELLERELETH